ncbi:MAG: NADPH-dependent FMN reductase, partial [Chloroflexota bacterium]
TDVTPASSAGEVPFMPDVVTINGSPASPSRCAATLDFVRAALARRGLTSEAIDVRDIDPVALTRASFDHRDLRDATALVLGARAVVVATPVYKASYSGVLKSFLDLLPMSALEGRTVLPMTTAGSLAHCLALDYALKPVLAALGARHILQGACLLDGDFAYLDDGAIALGGQTGERLTAAVDQLCAALGAGSVRETVKENAA